MPVARNKHLASTSISKLPLFPSLLAGGRFDLPILVTKVLSVMVGDKDLAISSVAQCPFFPTLLIGRKLHLAIAIVQLASTMARDEYSFAQTTRWPWLSSTPRSSAAAVWQYER